MTPQEIATLKLECLRIALSIEKDLSTAIELADKYYFYAIQPPAKI
jgi:hypothetical protein